MLRRQLPVIALVVAALPIPTFGSDYQVGLVARFMIFSIAAISLDLLWGYAGVVSFGHAIFFGLGAYATGICLRELGSMGGTAAGLGLALLIPAAVAAILGSFLFYSRVSGIYFGIVTLALTVVVQIVVISNRDFTGGLDGIYGFPVPTIGIPGLFSIEIWGVRAPYFAALVGLAVSLLIARWLTSSAFGVTMRALRDDEDRLELLGYSKAKLKTAVLMITAAMAGFAGALYTSVGFVSPSLFAVLFSTQILVWVALGGRGTLWGPIIGTFFVGYLETILSGTYQDFWPLIVGCVFVVVVVSGRNGIIDLVPRRWLQMRRQARSAEASDD